MKFLLCLSAILLFVIIVTKKTKEPFFGFTSRLWDSQGRYPPWYGSRTVPWHSNQAAYWQYPYQNLPWTHQFAPGGPATGQSITPPYSCPRRIWDQYQDQLRKYNDCKRCAPNCVIDTASGTCGKCYSSRISCEEQWGCPRSGGGYMPPVPPNLTSCSVCKN